MATLATQQVGRSGVKPTYAAAAVGGDAFVADARTLLHVKNGSASSITVTITPVASFDGIALSSVTVTVPASDERMAGPFAPEVFKDPSTGLVSVAYSAVATVTVAAIRN